MREYSKISPRFWTGDTGRAIRALGDDAMIVAWYLMSAPGSNMIGLYYLALPTLAHETGRTLEGASKALASLAGIDFAHYDPAREVVWVTNMAGHQIGETLMARDHQHKGVLAQLREHAKCPLSLQFWEKYSGPFNLPESSRPQAPSKPLPSPLLAPPSQEQEKEQEKEQEQKKKVASAADATRCPPGDAADGPAAKPDRLPFRIADALAALHETAGPKIPTVEGRDISGGFAIAINKAIRSYPTLDEWRVCGAFVAAGGVTFPAPPLGPSWVASGKFREAMAAARAWNAAGHVRIAGKSGRAVAAPVSDSFVDDPSDDLFETDVRRRAEQNARDRAAVAASRATGTATGTDES